MSGRGRSYVGWDAHFRRSYWVSCLITLYRREGEEEEKDSRSRYDIRASGSELDISVIINLHSDSGLGARHLRQTLRDVHKCTSIPFFIINNRIRHRFTPRWVRDRYWNVLRPNWRRRTPAAKLGKKPLSYQSRRLEEDPQSTSTLGPSGAICIRTREEGTSPRDFSEIYCDQRRCALEVNIFDAGFNFVHSSFSFYFGHDSFLFIFRISSHDDLRRSVGNQMRHVDQFHLFPRDRKSVV